MLTHSEENHLKCIYHLSSKSNGAINTNAIAKSLETKAASVTDMVQKLATKGLASYLKYKGVRLTTKGEKEALKVVRKHRIWEVFLVKELGYNWDQVHDIAEQLEHIKSATLIDKLDKFLEFPKFDPHGDPIPDANGVIASKPTTTLNILKPGDTCTVICAKDSSSDLLLFLDKVHISLGSKLEVIDYFEFDGSYSVKVDNGSAITLSTKVAENIFIDKL
ncbi:Mn-dependent transcriptional regulator MntR [hydrothermal vent metagenome]|uniref:Mn-dependent transcriptional regulator MntR n=1 Tax=hydrothermal vent metagenome TaxID=652676 RepID=A0A3B0ULG0_9ZZZZ